LSCLVVVVVVVVDVVVDDDDDGDDDGGDGVAVDGGGGDGEDFGFLFARLPLQKTAAASALATAHQVCFANLFLVIHEAVIGGVDDSAPALVGVDQRVIAVSRWLALPLTPWLFLGTLDLLRFGTLARHSEQALYATKRIIIFS
jgi:hypothetical protein